MLSNNDKATFSTNLESITGIESINNSAAEKYSGGAFSTKIGGGSTVQHSGTVADLTFTSRNESFTVNNRDRDDLRQRFRVTFTNTQNNQVGDVVERVGRFNRFGIPQGATRARVEQLPDNTRVGNLLNNGGPVVGKSSLNYILNNFGGGSGG